MITDACDIGGGGSLYQWQRLSQEVFASVEAEYRTLGMDTRVYLKHPYPEDGWSLVPLGHWNWKWNPARGNYCTYEEELLAGMLTIASQNRLISSNPVLWLCDQSSISSFVNLNTPPPENRKLCRWGLFLTQFHLVIKHILGSKKEMCEVLSRHNFDERVGEKTEELAREAFQRMDVQLDLAMAPEEVMAISPGEFLSSWRLWDYSEEYAEEMKGLEEDKAKLMEGTLWSKKGSLLMHEGQVVVPKHKLASILQWLHKTNGHPGKEKLLYVFLAKFYTKLSPTQLQKNID